MSVLKNFESGVTKQYWDLVNPVVQELGYEVYDLDYLSGSTTLRLYIRNQETKQTDIEDCVKVDHALTTPIQEAEWIPDTFTLEVSSPGIYRNLIKADHFIESVGERVEVVGMKKWGELLPDIKWPTELKTVKKLIGVIKGANENEIEMEIEKYKNIIKLNYAQISKAHLEPSFEQLMSKSERMDA
ncbi:MAG: hypothetical protein COW00_19750 [Bdellovibrio sp. CG12_big_fil_rev_8_21_14_0_65_39_13]|nr:MAG: hypothetical protein COW78_01925 [Bdellovibrio sp. CG22_combo_CG10-13_8_21_14_all_39_27]PIQ57610.1 MAG: hypothetical protein COW00_19750 [Bdellovibrio sp. CG12_big_fil_rev_8_21_14_0_65_39_13]PIR35774.1 MAG: hypothetical protein COV37_06130 [Bdellovibrio sp. CG11_big_fil_rev_8_21_14_0_20_39_38]